MRACVQDTLPFKQPGMTTLSTARRRPVKQILAAERLDLVPASVPTCTVLPPAIRSVPSDPARG